MEACRVYSEPNDKKIVEYYPIKELGKNSKKADERKLIGTFVGLKIRITKIRRDGSGALRLPKPNDRLDVILNYDLAEVKGKLEKGMQMKMRYDYSNGLSPTGIAESHKWSLLEVVDK